MDCYPSLGGGATCEVGEAWCDVYCASGADGCGEPPEGEVAPCVEACKGNEAGDCGDEWGAAQECVALDQALACDPELGAMPADGSCVELFTAFGACLDAPPGPGFP
jgi:hypothetical protein